MIIKRSGKQVKFNKGRISSAIKKAMKNGSGIYDESVLNKITDTIENIYLNKETTMTIHEIEDLVFDLLCENGHTSTAKAYEGYRKIREYQRQENTVDDKVWGLIDGTNKEMLDENSNKQSSLISTQRDLVAEEISKDIALRMMLPPHIALAHKEGIIHINDLGHYLNPSFNCCLVNLKDMLENGTVINGKMIEPPKGFRTACTVATQIIAQVASGQFGGQTISLAHLSPFVRIAENKIRERTIKKWENANIQYNNEQLENVVLEDLKREIEDGIQTLQYQINTLQTSNGQAPFLSMFMYLSEYPEYEKETAMLIEEVLRQRIIGLKNEVGVYISPAFPKLLYALDENNIKLDSKYRYLTELSAKCVVKRMMPDFLSVKKLKENYEGNIVPPMGK